MILDYEETGGRFKANNLKQGRVSAAALQIVRPFSDVRSLG